MANQKENLQASILDRLIDTEPGVSREPVQTRLLNVNQAKTSVIRDLENLLNTKRSVMTIPGSCREVNRSLLAYGLKDFTSSNPKSPMVRQQLRQEIERTIARFEPRLRNVKVHLEASGQSERHLRFRITALLVVEPLTEPVVFDTYFDVTRSEYLITK